jgi:hypothetical protein
VCRLGQTSHASGGFSQGIKDSERGVIMRKSSSIRFITQVERDLTLFKSVLKTFGHQPNTEWLYQENGKTDVVLVDIHEHEHYISKLEDARHLGHIVVFYSKETIELPTNTFLLRKPARARDVLSLLSLAEVRLAALAKQSEMPVPISIMTEHQPVLSHNQHKVAFSY